MENFRNRFFKNLIDQFSADQIAFDWLKQIFQLIIFNLQNILSNRLFLIEIFNLFSNLVLGGTIFVHFWKIGRNWKRFFEMLRSTIKVFQVSCKLLIWCNVKLYSDSFGFDLELPNMLEFQVSELEKGFEAIAH